MGYIKAEEILPLEMIELIQQYVDGTNIYIPRKQGNRRNWGEQTTYRCELERRNEAIYQERLAGRSINELADGYCLSEKSIQRIIRQEKMKKVY